MGIYLMLFIFFFLLGITFSYVLSRGRVRELRTMLSDFYLENQALILRIQEIEAKLNKRS